MSFEHIIDDFSLKKFYREIQIRSASNALSEMSGRLIILH